MNTYKIILKDETEHEIIAETPGKAKYQLYKEECETYEYKDGFKGFLQYIKSCKTLHKFKVSDLFNHNDTFENMKKRRNLDFAFVGMNVEVDGRKGVITGANNSLNIDVCFLDAWWSQNCHPHWKTKYFDNNGVLVKEYGGE